MEFSLAEINYRACVADADSPLLQRMLHSFFSSHFHLNLHMLLVSTLCLRKKVPTF